MTVRSKIAQYISTTLLTVMFCVSFLSGSPWHYAITFFFLLLFIIYNSFDFAFHPAPVLSYLRKYYPIPFYLSLAFLCSSSISLLLVWLDDVETTQKIGQSIKHFYYALMFTFCFSLAWFVSNHPLKLERVWLFFSIGIWILLLQLFVIYYFFDAPNYINWANNPPVGGNLRLVGMSLSMACCIFLIQVLFKPLSKPLASFYYFSIFAFLIALSWSGSRTSILLSFFMLAVFYWFKSQKQGYLKPLPQFFLLVLLFLAAMIIGHNLPAINGGGLGRLARFLLLDEHTSLMSEEYLTNLGNGRIALWLNSIEVIKQHPWFGLGPFGYFYFSMFQGEHTDHVHNIFLQFLVEWGIIGAVLMTALIAYLASTFIKQGKQAAQTNDTEFLSAFSLVVLLTLNGLTDGTYSGLLPIFFVICAYSYLLIRPFEQVLTRQQSKVVAQRVS